jgi:hypothetical protein
MPDWRGLVRQRLGGIRLREHEAAEVIEELADHLEDAYRGFLRKGLPEAECVQEVLREVSSWRDLRAEIESSREKEAAMNKRVSQFWFPALLTLFLSQTALMLIQEFAPRVYLSPAAAHPRMLPQNAVFAAWLVTLPLIGALGAYLSGRAGGHAKSVFAAVTFPVLPFLALVLIGLPLALLFDDHVARGFSLPLFFVAFSAWVVFPAMALGAGGWLLFHLRRRPRGSQVSGI